MEQQNKYYTPSIEELHVGYKCEHLNINGDEDVWENIIWPSPYYHQSSGWIEYNDRHIGKLRTKYLCREDIESCGWKHTGEQLVSHGRQDYEKAGMMLKHFPRHHSLFIAKAINPDAMDGFAEKLFDGECKSINELKKIMQWLNIK